MTTYLLISETTTAYGSVHNSYGIRIVRNRLCVREIRDITCDRERLSSLIRDMNELLLDPIHVDEIIEDFLRNR